MDAARSSGFSLNFYQTEKYNDTENVVFITFILISCLKYAYKWNV
jgi:hypothetical protein